MRHGHLRQPIEIVLRGYEATAQWTCPHVSGPDEFEAVGFEGAGG